MGCSEASRNWICTCSAYVHTLHIETNCSTATISWRLSAIHRCHVCTRLYVDRGHGYGNSETRCKSIVLFNWRRHAEPKWNQISLKTDTPFWKQTHDSQWISMSKRCSTVQWLKGQMHHHDDLGSKCAYTCHLSNKTTRKSVLLSTPQIWQSLPATDISQPIRSRAGSHFISTTSDNVSLHTHTQASFLLTFISHIWGVLRRTDLRVVLFERWHV